MRREREGEEQEVSFWKFGHSDIGHPGASVPTVCVPEDSRGQALGMAPTHPKHRAPLQLAHLWGCGELEHRTVGEKCLFTVGDWHLLPRGFCHLSVALLTPRTDSTKRHRSLEREQNILLTLLEGKVGRVTYHRLLFLCLEAFGGSPDHLVFLLGLPSSLTASDLLRIYPPLPAPHHKCMEHRRTWARTARAPEKPHPSRPGGRKGSRKI